MTDDPNSEDLATQIENPRERSRDHVLRRWLWWAALPLACIVGALCFGLEGTGRLWLYGVILSLTMIPRNAHRATIVWSGGVQTNAARAKLEELGYDVKHVDGDDVCDAPTLAKALDGALGPMTFPEGPEARVYAHVDNESRGIGRVALLFTGADTLRSARPDVFEEFVKAWRKRCRPSHKGERLLVLDAVEPKPA